MCNNTNIPVTLPDASSVVITTSFSESSVSTINSSNSIENFTKLQINDIIRI